MHKNRKWAIASISVVVIFIAIQFVPASIDNPAVETDIGAPEEVARILRTSCYDCHSNETNLPWYASVAPASWFLKYHVSDARDHFNFSTWNRYDARKRRKILEEMREEVEEGEMPLRSYLLIHREAALDDADREVLFAWIDAQTAGEAPASEGEDEEENEHEH